MISDKFRCIFVHIPKTAGTSIEYKLRSFDTLETGVQDHRSIREMEPGATANLIHDIVTANHEMLLNHLKNTIRRKRRATPEQFESYYKFTFIRNPWARAHSWYKNVMRDENHRKKHGIPEGCTFETFLADHPNQWALQPQLYWLQDRKGNIPLDFIGRFENLAEDFNHVCDVLQLGITELPHMISSKSKSHHTEFYNERTMKIVADRYAEEIEHFGYRFDE